MTKEEAIKVANEMYGWLKTDREREALETLIPELSESDDERVRKGLINFLQSPFIKENLTDEKVAPWIAYLEKQKKQKSIISAEESLGISQEEYNKIVDECIFGEQKEKKPVEWSEEDKATIKEICDFLYETSIGVYRSIEQDTFKRWINCLKSL